MTVRHWVKWFGGPTWCGEPGPKWITVKAADVTCEACLDANPTHYTPINAAGDGYDSPPCNPDVEGFVTERAEWVTCKRCLALMGGRQGA